MDCFILISALIYLHNHRSNLSNYSLYQLLGLPVPFLPCSCSGVDGDLNILPPTTSAEGTGMED